MGNKQKTIDACYKMLKLDNRASKKEVELAFEVLTNSKNLASQDYKRYRYAFEFLMYEVYGANNACEPVEEDVTSCNENVWNNTITYLPQNVLNSIESWEKFNDTELDNKTKAVFATQIVNLPMFFNAIIKNTSRNFFGKFFWSDKNMNDIINETCVNPMIYNDMTFELTYNGYKPYEKIYDLRDFVNNLKKIHLKDKYLCKRFETHNTQYGIMAHCIIEHSLAGSIMNMLKVKANQVECSLNLTVSGDGY